MKRKEIYMDIKQAIEQFYALQSKMSAYSHAMSMIYYDGATVAPKGTAQNRAHALAVLSEETYKLSTGDETVALLDFLGEHKDELNEKDFPELTRRALKEANPLYPVPVIWGWKDVNKVLKRVKEG